MMSPQVSERRFPRIAPYHSGPYSVAAILQDPGSIHGNGCGAVATGEVGVLNDDPTARLCRKALDRNGIPLSAYLPLNAVPWYDSPGSIGRELLEEGAAHNRQLIIGHGVGLVLLCGAIARRSERFLRLPTSITVRHLPHPGNLGLLNFRDESGVRIGRAVAIERFITGFAIPEAAPHA